MDVRSGDLARYLPFLAIAETDLLTKLTGLSAFTVYRARDGATPNLMSTPTIIEADATNMPGLYWLLLDEDMAVTAGNAFEMMAFTIHHASMISVYQVVQLTDMPNRIPDALDDGFLKTAIKKVGLTVLTPSGGGGQKYGG